MEDRRMMLSRAKPAVGGTPPSGDRRRKKGKEVPQLEELLAQRDFTGAIALLEFKQHVGEEEEDGNLWIGYCAFHLGDYKRALEILKQSLGSGKSTGNRILRVKDSAEFSGMILNTI
uniref:Intraflagellar transport protein 56 n=1 Tax=Ficedula albicollis TaxID=59894 RepID=A0A803VBH7_FICAL